MKRRQMKRVMKKVLVFLAMIVVLSLITAKIVEKRMGNQGRAYTPIDDGLDPNGDPTTKPFSTEFKTKMPMRPRPPVLEKEFVYIISTTVTPENIVDYTFLNKKFPYFELQRPAGELKIWENPDYVALERKRVGFGEHGEAAYITDEALKDLERNMSLANGFNALLSDYISVNRSVPDVRREGCKNRKYLAKLPTTSVVFPFYNEHFSVLVRSLHSVVNKTPKELLKEIIIVDDFSDREDIKQQLDDYVAANFGTLVKIIRLQRRTGLIGTRLAGARQATGDVLVFFDSHIECNYNWLPPLLEPIAINPRISTCPIVDVIDHTNFAYSGGHQNGYRGAFDWNLKYKSLPILTEDEADNTRPYQNPVMVGGLFAIGREFFWELGGYDEELDIWGAEQFELSFKIWMCGGMLLDIPCSRVAHIFRGPMEERPSPRDYNFVARNQKRVAEVWMDDYKKYIYMREPEVYGHLDAGDMSKQKAIREKLQCKSFQWFLDIVVPDLIKQFPPIPPPNYCEGVIQSLAYPKYCLDTLNNGANQPVGLFQCAENKTHPQSNQFWALGHHRDIHLVKGSDVCLDVQDTNVNATVYMWSCHQSGGNQFWYYDRQHQWLVHGIGRHYCLEAVVTNKKVGVCTNLCDPDNERMKWTFGKIDNEMLDNFFKGLDK